MKSPEFNPDNFQEKTTVRLSGELRELGAFAKERVSKIEDKDLKAILDLSNKMTLREKQREIL